MTVTTATLESSVAELSVDVSLNWAGVGRAFAHADAGAQVEFLLGMAVEFEQLGVVASEMQAAFIAGAMPDGNSAMVAAEKLERLALHLRDRSESDS